MVMGARDLFNKSGVECVLQRKALKVIVSRPNNEY